MTPDNRPDFSRSIQELEESDWGDPKPADTWMVRTIHAIRRKPVSSLTDEELRLAVSQQVGEPFVVFLAIERLEQDPLLEGGCYPGDILSALIRQTSEEVWDSNPGLRSKLTSSYERALARAAEDTDSFRESLGLPSGGARQ